MAKILVTGGAGFIGSHTVHLLLKRGHDVVVVDDLSKGYRHNVDPGRLTVLRLQETRAITELLVAGRVDAVIHFAAFIAVGESTQVPEVYFENNVSGSLSLLTAMIGAGVSKIVFSSTAAVYGEPVVSPIPEDLLYAPVSPYGDTKVIVEKLLGWMDQYRGIRSVILRYFNACGAAPKFGLGEEHEPETHLIPLMLRAVAGGKPLTIFGTDYPTSDGSCMRDYIHVLDLASAHILAVEHLLSGGGSNKFNVGTGNGLTVFEVLKAVEKVTGKPVPHSLGPRRSGDPAALVADSSKLQRAFGWKPERSDLETVVRDAYEFEPIRLARARH